MEDCTQNKRIDDDQREIGLLQHVGEEEGEGGNDGDDAGYKLQDVNSVWIKSTFFMKTCMLVKDDDSHRATEEQEEHKMAAPLCGEVEVADPEGWLPIDNLGEEDGHQEQPGHLADLDKVGNAQHLLDTADHVDKCPRKHADRKLGNFE